MSFRQFSFCLCANRDEQRNIPRQTLKLTSSELFPKFNRTCLQRKNDWKLNSFARKCCTEFKLVLAHRKYLLLSSWHGQHRRFYHRKATTAWKAQIFCKSPTLNHDRKVFLRRPWLSGPSLAWEQSRRAGVVRFAPSNTLSCMQTTRRSGRLHRIARVSRSLTCLDTNLTLNCTRQTKMAKIVHRKTNRMHSRQCLVSNQKACMSNSTHFRFIVDRFRVWIAVARPLTAKA